MDIESVDSSVDEEQQKMQENERLQLNPGYKISGDELEFQVSYNSKIDDDIKAEIKQYHDNISSKKGLIEMEDIVRGTVKVEKGYDDRFVGSQCMGIRDNQLDTDLTSIEYIRKNTNDYYVCAKSDGVRYLMYIFSNGKTYLGGRNLEFFRVPIYFPPFAMKTMHQVDEEHDGKELEPEQMYLFDGELIQSDSKKLKGFKTEIQYLFFDAIYYQKKSQVNNPYSVRIGYLRGFECDCRFYNTFFISNRKKFDEKLEEGCFDYLDIKIEENNNTEPGSPSEKSESMKLEKQAPKQEITRHERRKEIVPYVKDFFMAYEIDFLLNKIVDSNLLPHENDGQIFTKIKYPYLPGKSKGVLKWKPKELNTVDFLISENKELKEVCEDTDIFNGEFNIFDLYIVVGKNIFIFDYLFVFTERDTIKIAKEFKTYHFGNTGTEGIEGIIAECKYFEDSPVLIEKEQVKSPKAIMQEEYENDPTFRQIVEENEKFQNNISGPKKRMNTNSNQDTKDESEIEYEPTNIDMFYAEFDHNESESFDVIWENQQPIVYDGGDNERNRKHSKIQEIKQQFWYNLNHRLTNAKNGCKQGNWSLFRLRQDKLYPNSFNTAKNIVDEIFNQGLSKEDLIKKLCKTKNN